MDVLIFRALSLLGLAILVALAARRVHPCCRPRACGRRARRHPQPCRPGAAHDLIFDVVVPPLLFEAVRNLCGTDFRRDLVPLVALSTIGAALCALVVASGLAAQVRPRLRGADRRKRPDRRHRCSGNRAHGPAQPPHRSRVPVDIDAARRRGGLCGAKSSVRMGLSFHVEWRKVGACHPARACLQLTGERIGIGRGTFGVSDTRGIPESANV